MEYSRWTGKIFQCSTRVDLRKILSSLENSATKTQGRRTNRPNRLSRFEVLSVVSGNASASTLSNVAAVCARSSLVGAQQTLSPTLIGGASRRRPRRLSTAIAWSTRWSWLRCEPAVVRKTQSRTGRREGVFVMQSAEDRTCTDCTGFVMGDP